MKLLEIDGWAEVNECRDGAHPAGSHAVSVWGLNFCRATDDHFPDRAAAREAAYRHNLRLERPTRFTAPAADESCGPSLRLIPRPAEAVTDPDDVS